MPLPVWFILAVFSFLALPPGGESMCSPIFSCKCFVASLNQGSPSSLSTPVLLGTAEFSLGALSVASSVLTSGQLLSLHCEHCQSCRPWRWLGFLHSGDHRCRGSRSVYQVCASLSLALDKAGCRGYLTEATPERFLSTGAFSRKRCENWTGRNNTRLKYLLHEV